MSGPLGTTVFKIPNIAEKGYQIEQIELAKQERERRDRERSIEATGAESLYNRAKYKIEGDAATGASMLYNQFRKSSIEFEQTGSESAKNKMNDYSAQLETYITAILSQNGNAGRSLAEAEADGFQNYTMAPDEARQAYSNFMNRSMEFTMKDGTLMIKDGDSFVPAFQSSYFTSTALNPNNSFVIPRAVKEGQYVFSRNFLTKYSDGIMSAGSKSAALDFLNDELEYLFENDKSFVSDVAVAYDIEKGVISGDRGLSAQDIANANAKMSDPVIREKAFENYKASISSDLDRMFRRGSTRTIGSLPSYGDIYEDTNVTMYALPRAVGGYSAVGMDASGNYYIQTKESVVDGMVVGGEIKPATEGQVAQIEAATKISIRPQAQAKSREDSVDRTGGLSQAPVTLKAEMPINQAQIQKYIDAKSGGNSPITAKDIMDVSAKYNVPVELILAQGAKESNFGTEGRGARTNNIFNLRNVTAGDTMVKDSPEQKAKSYRFDSWLEGLDAYASLLSRRYAPDGNWEKLLDNFVNDEGSRYAEAPGYEDSLKRLINELYDMTPEKSVSSQDGFDSQAARSKYGY